MKNFRQYFSRINKNKLFGASLSLGGVSTAASVFHTSTNKQPRKLRPNFINDDDGMSTYSSLSPKSPLLFQNKRINKKLVWIIRTGNVQTHKPYTKALISALEARGFTVKDLKSQSINISLYLQEQPELPCFVLSRLGAATQFYEFSLYQLLESLGVPVINSPLSIDRCSDRLFTYSVLSSKGFPVPHSILVNTSHKAKDLLETYQMKLPLIFRVTKESGKTAIFEVRDEHQLSQYLRIFKYFAKSTTVMAQELVERSRNNSVYVWIVGNKVVGAVVCDNRGQLKKNSTENPRKANIDEKTKKMAIDASLSLGLDYSGVNLLYDGKDESGNQKWKINNISSAPQWELMGEVYNNTNFAENIVNHICDKYEVGNKLANKN